MEAFGTHLHIDLQQRGVEFSQLFRDYSHLRPALLEKMPKLQKSLTNGNGDGNGTGGGLFDENSGGIDLIESGGDEMEIGGLLTGSSEVKLGSNTVS